MKNRYGVGLVIFMILLLVACKNDTVENIKAVSKTENEINNEVKTEESSDNITGDKIEDEVSAEEESVDEDEELNVTPEKIGSLMSIGDCAVEIFGGDENIAKTYAETISDYADKLSGRNVYNIIVPSHIEYILPKKYSDLSKSQKDNIEVIKNSESENVKFIDIYDALKKHKNEYIYFNTDHHWTALGAYYAYCEYAKDAGFEAINLDDFEVKRKENFLGSFYANTKDASLAENADYVEYYSVGSNGKAYLYKDSASEEPVLTTVYAEYAEGTYAYGVFLHGDNPLMKIENSENTSANKAVLIKESYGNAFAPFLIPHYSELYVVDLRYFDKNLIDFINENNINDVIFINNIFAANTMMHIEKLQKMK